MDYGLRKFTGSGKVVDDAQFFMEPNSDKGWLCFPVSFGKSGEPESTFEIKLSGKLAETLRHKIKNGHHVFIEGKIGSVAKNFDLFDCGDMGFYANTCLFYDEQKIAPFIKGSLYGLFTQEPELHRIKSSVSNKLLSGCVRVPYTTKDSGNKNMFINLVAFNKKAEEAYSKLMRDEHCYLEGRFARKRQSDGSWKTNLILNHFVIKN